MVRVRRRELNYEKNPWVVASPSCWFVLLLSCSWVKLKLLEPPKQFHFRAAPTPLMIRSLWYATATHVVCILYIHASWTSFNITVNHITKLILQTHLQECHFFKDIRDSQKQIKSILHHLLQNPSLFAERALPTMTWPWKTTAANYLFTFFARTDKVKNTNRSKEALRLWMVRHRSFLQSSLITSEWFQIRILWITDPCTEEMQVATTLVKHIVACHGICIKPSEHQ